MAKSAKVVRFGYMWFYVAKNGEKWFYVAKSGEKWFYVVQRMYYLKDNT